jgi:hypothetical protein
MAARKLVSEARAQHDRPVVAGSGGGLFGVAGGAAETSRRDAPQSQSHAAPSTHTRARSAGRSRPQPMGFAARAHAKIATINWELESLLQGEQPASPSTTSPASTRSKFVDDMRNRAAGSTPPGMVGSPLRRRCVAAVGVCASRRRG